MPEPFATALFSDLAHPALAEALARVATVRQLSADTVLMHEGDAVSAVPIVRSGRLRVVRQDEDGRELLLYYIQPGESCVMSLLGAVSGQTSRVTAVVEEAAEVLLLPAAYVPRWLGEYPAWGRYVLQLYGQRFEELLGTVNALAFQRLDERLLHLLREKVRLGGTTELPVTHQQLAHELGTAREVVSRLLKQLENMGVVALHRNRVTLLQPRAAPAR